MNRDLKKQRREICLSFISGNENKFASVGRTMSVWQALEMDAPGMLLQVFGFLMKHLKKPSACGVICLSEEIYHDFCGLG